MEGFEFVEGDLKNGGLGVSPGNKGFALD